MRNKILDEIRLGFFINKLKKIEDYEEDKFSIKLKMVENEKKTHIYISKNLLGHFKYGDFFFVNTCKYYYIEVTRYERYKKLNVIELEFKEKNVKRITKILKILIWKNLSFKDKIEYFLLKYIVEAHLYLKSFKEVKEKYGIDIKLIMNRVKIYKEGI